MSSAGTSGTRQTVTRGDLIGLGRAGRAREFIPVVCQVLERVPGDAGLRFLLAANAAQLGLRTLAGEILAELPASARGEPDVRALAAAIERLPDDRVAAGVRRATAVGNLRALRVRGIDLSREYALWSERLDLNDCYRCADGNIVRRMRWEGAPHWSHFVSDQRGAAERFAAKSLVSVDQFPRPLAIEGVDPPWLFELAWRKLPRNRMGYATPITVVQADPQEFLDGLSVCDLRGAFVDPRVRVFVGPDASQRWLNDALERLDEVVLGAVAPLGVTRTRTTPTVEAAMGRASAAQAEEFRRLQAIVEERYRGRDAGWWARRYAEARSGGRPLRVLVPTSRYSTYIRHAAEDLAEAFRAAGCEAMVAMEARSDSRPSTVGYVRTIERFEPDLIALINYFRGDAGLPFPERIPWLCWVQDALPHQFKEREWTGLDFVAGHVHKELLSQPSFPRERTRQFPVVASAAKFHAGPVDHATRERFACEVAYVSHQSETPEAFHERCEREDGDPAAARVLGELRPLVEAEALEPMGTSLAARLEQLTRVVCASAIASEERARYVFRHYSLPLADRVIRHQMLGWAAEICLRRGWRLRIYGRGWEHDGGLARFARGEVSHGEELRACYRCSLVHLHASVNTLVHQRVMECALSGGLPLARLTYDAVSESAGWAKREAMLHCTPVERDGQGRLGFATADSAALREFAEQSRRVGIEFPEVTWLPPVRAEAFRSPDHPAATGLHPVWLYGDLAEGTFRSADGLERALEALMDDPRVRERRSAEMAARVRERCTTEVFARRMLELIGDSLAGAAGGQSRAA